MFFLFILVVASAAANLLLRISSLHVSIKMHDSLLSKIIRAPLDFFESTPIGRILSRFSGDIETVDKVLVQCLSDFVWCLFEVFSIILTISITSPEFLLVIWPIGLMYYLLQRYYITTGRQIKRLESISKSPIFSQIGETLQGVAVIRAFNAQERYKICLILPVHFTVPKVKANSVTSHIASIVNY